jgi:transcriptional regulator with XRE-family HTH domain
MGDFSKSKFAAFVKKTREQHKLSLRETSRRSGLTLARVFAIENGDTRLSVPQLQGLAAAFGFSSGSEFLELYEMSLRTQTARSKGKAPREKVYTFGPARKVRPRRPAVGVGG